MANVFSGLRWIIDTASPLMVTTERIKVKGIRWVYEGATAGDNCVVQDADGNVLWETVAAGVNYSEAELLEDWWETGFKVPTLAGGRLIITLC